MISTSVTSSNCAALCAIARSANPASIAGFAIKRSTSAVAFSRSIASFSCLVRVSSFSCRSATEGRPWRAAPGELRFGLVVCRAAFLLISELQCDAVSLSAPPGPTAIPYHIIGTVVHHSKTGCPTSESGQEPTLPGNLGGPRNRPAPNSFAPQQAMLESLCEFCHRVASVLRLAKSPSEFLRGPSEFDARSASARAQWSYRLAPIGLGYFLTPKLDRSPSFRRP